MRRERALKVVLILVGLLFTAMIYVNADEKVIRFSRSRPEPVIQREPRSTGTR